MSLFYIILYTSYTAAPCLKNKKISLCLLPGISTASNLPPLKASFSWCKDLAFQSLNWCQKLLRLMTAHCSYTVQTVKSNCIFIRWAFNYACYNIFWATSRPSLRTCPLRVGVYNARCVWSWNTVNVLLLFGTHLYTCQFLYISFKLITVSELFIFSLWITLPCRHRHTVSMLKVQSKGVWVRVRLIVLNL